MIPLSRTHVLAKIKASDGVFWGGLRTTSPFIDSFADAVVARRVTKFSGVCVNVDQISTGANVNKTLTEKKTFE